MSRFKTCSTAILGAMAVGCASFGPLGTAEFEPTLRKDVPAIEGEILFRSPASLLYGIDGYGMSDQLLVHMKVPPKDKYIEGEGIAVLTAQKLFFVKWSGKKYENRWTLDYRDIESIEMRAFGAGRMLVAKLKGTPPVVSYQIASDSGQTIDTQRTITVCQLVAQHAGTKCQLPQ